MELQNKMRGFLDDLKLEVENKDRLKTVRENPKQETEFKREPDGQAAVPLEQEQ